MVVNVYVSAVTTDNVSRTELVAWVNSLLQAQLSKIEQMSTGAAYCQLTHILFPENIILKKVKWNSKSEMDHINNWKILGVAWKDIGVDKPVPVEKLVKGKFQDNYEFLQWFYKFFNANAGNIDSEEYNALGHRGGEEFPAGAKGPVPARAAPVRATAPPPAVKKVPVVRSSPAAASLTDKPTAVNSEADKAVIENFKATIAENQEALETAERERDFYFEKLRLVEDMCNELLEGQQLNKDKVLAILYAADNSNIEEPAPTENATHEDQHVELDDSETF